MSEPHTRIRPVQPAGRNQAAMRAYNERLVLTLVRRRGALARSEIARLTGLTPQTTSVIVQSLETEGLLQRGSRRRGRVGQPSIPFTLDPDGAYFIGVKIGRRSFEVVLTDFCGTVLRSDSEARAVSTPDATVARVLAAVSGHLAFLGDRADRIAGLGLAMPSRIWDWDGAGGVPSPGIEDWRGRDIRAEIAALVPLRVWLQNDASAACGAELAFGDATDLRDFLHIFVGTFIGGGVVLNRRLVTGHSGNAGALGSMPVPDGSGGTVQLLERASLILLERGLAPGRGPLHGLTPCDWARIGPPLDAWIATAARAIAHAVVAAASVIDFETAIIDGAFPAAIRDRLCAAIAADMAHLDLSGIDPPTLRPGSLGPLARALGGASLPLFERFMVDECDLSAPRIGRPSPAGPARAQP